MENKNCDCIRHYILNNYKGGLIGISDLADYCIISEGEVYVSLLSMESNGELMIVKRYFCPDFHTLEVIAEKRTYCTSCEIFYPNDQIEIAIYVNPKTY